MILTGRAGSNPASGTIYWGNCQRENVAVRAMVNSDVPITAVRLRPSVRDQRYPKVKIGTCECRLQLSEARDGMACTVGWQFPKSPHLCTCDETGRHSGLKHHGFRAYRFESYQVHQFICRYSIMAIMSAFQAEDESSILSTCSIKGELAEQ